MGQKIINRGVVNFQQPPLFGTPVPGSSNDMYPEMEAFDMREQFEYIMNGNFEEPGGPVTASWTVPAADSWVAGIAAFYQSSGIPGALLMLGCGVT